MYGFSITVKGRFEEVIDRVTAELKKEGFGVLSDINVQQALKEKIGVTMPPYRILGACNPPLAYQAITAEPEIGLLLPCNVLVRATEQGEIIVSFMDPEAVLQLVDKDSIHQLALEVRQRLMRVRDALAL